MVDDLRSVSRIKEIHSGNAKLLQLEVGRLLAAIGDEQNKIATLQDKIAAATVDTSLVSLANRTTWMAFIQRQIQACQERMHELQKQHKAVQLKWHAAEQQVDAIGTLLTTRRAAARRKQMQKDLIESDEIVGRTSQRDSTQSVHGGLS